MVAFTAASFDLVKNTFLFLRTLGRQDFHIPQQHFGIRPQNSERSLSRFEKTFSPSRLQSKKRQTAFSSVPCHLSNADESPRVRVRWFLMDVGFTSQLIE